MDILNRENSYVNFSSLIFPGGKLSQRDENMKISKVFQNFKITLYFFILFLIMLMLIEPFLYPLK